MESTSALHQIPVHNLGVTTAHKLYLPTCHRKQGFCPTPNTQNSFTLLFLAFEKARKIKAANDRLYHKHQFSGYQKQNLVMSSLESSKTTASLLNYFTVAVKSKHCWSPPSHSDWHFIVQDSSFKHQDNPFQLVFLAMNSFSVIIILQELLVLSDWNALPAAPSSTSFHWWNHISTFAARVWNLSRSSIFQCFFRHPSF